jgi:hypothetical protein
MIMSDIYQVTTQIIDQYALPIALTLAALVIVIFLNRRKIKLGWLNFKTRYCLNHLGVKQKSNIQWPDGLGHYFTIDRLILRHDGISLLVYKQYPGKIFCADHIDDWTQMLGKKSYRFKNPLADLDYQIKAVSACIPDVPVNGFLFFDHLAEFPKGHPDRIIHPKKIPEELKRSKKQQVDTSVMSAWKKLLTMA